MSDSVSRYSARFLGNEVIVKNPSQTWKRKVNELLFPKTMSELIHIVKKELQEKGRIKTICNGHSFSEVAETSPAIGTLVDLSRMTIGGIVDRDKHNESVSTLKRFHNNYSDFLINSGLINDQKARYINIPSWLNINQINQFLAPEDKNGDTIFSEPYQLYNMSGTGHLSIGGTFSTGTHGSGGVYSAIHDFVKSILMVDGRGVLVRVEPADSPITNPVGYNEQIDGNDVELIQDDDKFYAALVSFGCFGVIYSVVLEVIPLNHLFEEVHYSEDGLSGLFEKLDNSVFNGDGDENSFNYLMINPYEKNDGDFMNTHVYRKVVVQENPPQRAIKDILTRNKRRERFFKRKFLQKLVRRLLGLKKEKIKKEKRKILNKSLKSQLDEKGSGAGYYGMSYRVLDNDSGVMAKWGTAIEFAFPINQASNVIKEVLMLLNDDVNFDNNIHLNSPIALRFAKSSKAYLSQNYKEINGSSVPIWCYIELIKLNGISDKDDERLFTTFRTLQKLLKKKSNGRVHWGLNFDFDFDHEYLEKRYPKLDKWKEAFEFFNPNALFDNIFTDKCGFRKSADLNT